MDFVANPWSIEVNQNRSFVVSVVLIALVQSVRKSDGRICGDRALIEERSVVAKWYFRESRDILCIVSRGIARGAAFVRFSRAARDSVQIIDV